MATKEDFSKNQGPETNTEKASNPSGLYRHPGSGVETVVINDPLYASAADAYVRLGFELIGEVPASYYEETALAVASANPKSTSSPDALAGIEARLKLLEQENMELKAAAEAVVETPTQVTEEPDSPETQEEEVQTSTTTPDMETVTTSTNDVTPEPDLRSMSLDELYSIAAEEKVRGYTLYKSTDKLVDAIEKSRSEKGNE